MARRASNTAPIRRTSVVSAPTGGPVYNAPASAEGLLDALDLAINNSAPATTRCLADLQRAIQRSIVEWQKGQTATPELFDSVLAQDLVPMLTDAALVHSLDKWAVVGVLDMAQELAQHERSRRAILKSGILRKLVLFMRLFVNDADVVAKCVTLRYSLMSAEFSAPCKCIPYFLSAKALPKNLLKFWIEYDMPEDFLIMQKKQAEAAAKRRATSAAGGRASGARVTVQGGNAAEKAMAAALAEKTAERKATAQAAEKQLAIATKAVEKGAVGGSKTKDGPGKVADPATAKDAPTQNDYLLVDEEGPPKAEEEIDMSAIADAAEAYRAVRREEIANESVPDGELPKRRSSLVYLGAIGQSVDSSLLGQKKVAKKKDKEAAVMSKDKFRSKDRLTEWTVPQDGATTKAQRMLTMGKDVPTQVLKDTQVQEKTGILLVPVDIAASRNPNLTEAEEIARATQFRGTQKDVDNPDQWDADLQAGAGAQAAAMSAQAGGRRSSMAGGIVGQMKVPVAGPNGEGTGGGDGPDAYVIKNRRMSMDEYLAQGTLRAGDKGMTQEERKQFAQAQARAKAEELEKGRKHLNNETRGIKQEAEPSPISAVQIAYAKENARVHGRRASTQNAEGPGTPTSPDSAAARRGSAAGGAPGGGGRRKSALTLEARIARMQDADRKKLQGDEDDDDMPIVRKVSLPGSLQRRRLRQGWGYPHDERGEDQQDWTPVASGGCRHQTGAGEAAGQDEDDVQVLEDRADALSLLTTPRAAAPRGRGRAGSVSSRASSGGRRR